MMTSEDFIWAARLMQSKYGMDGHARALRQASALRVGGCHDAAALWTQIATLLVGVPAGAATVPCAGLARPPA